MASSLTLLRQFIRQPGQIGTIAPSGPALVREMVGGFDWASIEAAVEYGPGTGVFTAEVMRRKSASTKFFAIERGEALVAATRSRCPDVDVAHDDVRNVRRLCADRQIDRVDAIVCGLPWAAFGESLQTEILREMFGVLPPGGRFATFAYVQGMALRAARRFSRRLDNEFTEVRRSRVVWRNLPPAFVYHCVR